MNPTSLTVGHFRSRIFSILHILAIAAFVAPAQAADTAAKFPSEQIRIVVPFTAGRGTDVVARIVAKHLADTWKVAVIVDNRVGAGGVVGSQYVTTQKPDGSTLLAVASAFAVRSAIDRTVPYEVSRTSPVLKSIGWEPTPPRFFTLDSSGGLLCAAKLDGDSNVTFHVNHETEKFMPTGQIVETGSNSCIVGARH